MNRVARFILLLVVGLGVLTWIADGVLSRTTRKWFEADIRLRSQLAVAASRHALIDHIRAGDGAGRRAGVGGGAGGRGVFLGAPAAG